MQVLKRIVRAEVPAVLIPDLKVFLRNVGDSRDLLAPNVYNQVIFTLSEICESNDLDVLIKSGKLTLWDESGQIVGNTTIERATNVATLRESGTGGGSGIAERIIQESMTVTIDGTASFTLSVAPLYNNGVIMFVNGNNEIYGQDYTVSGTTVTWLGFGLVAGDQINFAYEKAI
jgi:hypothetical protein